MSKKIILQLICFLHPVISVIKKNSTFLCILIILVTCKTTQAQWTSSGSDIYYTGYVGIGTTTPTTVFYVKGSNATLTTLERTNSSLNVNIQYKNATNSIFAGLDKYGGFTIANNIDLLPNSLLTVQANGNVGIGITNPTQKLAVNGDIRAKEIKVEMSGWPDYVFSKNYKLPSLKETETHIKENGHLPGMPSAKEVETNGVDLGEMNKKLLQKIEELTLYLIEERKLNTENQEKLTEQKDTVSALDDKLTKFMDRFEKLEKANK